MWVWISSNAKHVVEVENFVEKHVNSIYGLMNLCYIPFNHEKLENRPSGKKSPSLDLLLFLTKKSHDLRSTMIAKEHKALESDYYMVVEKYNKLA